MKKILLMGYTISSGGVFYDVKQAYRFIFNRSNTHYLACANPHSLVIAEKDDTFKQSLIQADILVPDGSGIVFAAKLMKLNLRKKVAGSDFFRECNKMAEAVGNIRYFFLGSSEKVLAFITKRINKEYPHITVCGTYSPPFSASFSDAENNAMLEAVNTAEPDILWVGMTAPKQEKWIYANKDKLNVPFIGAIGAVFDFYAGTKHRSSNFWIGLGLEWLPRFLKEPKRLWERNLKSTPIFLWWILKEKIRIIRARYPNAK